MTRLEQELETAGGLLRLTEDGFQKPYLFSGDCVAFDGHFPDSPILPGVVQLMMGAHTAVEALGESFNFHKVSKAKFLKPILPDEPILVSGKTNRTQTAVTAAITIHSGEVMAASFTLTSSKVAQ